jgi:hypothetical protein
MRLLKGMPPEELPAKRSTGTQEMSRERWKKRLMSSLLPPFITLGVLTKRNYDSLNAKGHVGEKPCIVNNDMGVGGHT